jgi:hypothetical protein
MIMVMCSEVASPVSDRRLLLHIQHYATNGWLMSVVAGLRVLTDTSACWASYHKMT